MSFFDKVMNVLNPLATAASAITGNPVVAAIAAALKIIDKVEDATDEDRTEMYAELAKGLGEVSAVIIEALEDGNISDAEHKQIVAVLEDIVSELDD